VTYRTDDERSVLEKLGTRACRAYLVYICDPAIPRREWMKGVVEKVDPDADGVPR